MGMDSLRKNTVWDENKEHSRPLRCFVVIVRYFAIISRAVVSLKYFLIVGMSCDF